MSRKASKLERRVHTALLYINRHSEFYSDEIKLECKIPRGRYEDKAVSEILRGVKDAAPFELWPVYERPGWWTTSPTAEIRIVAMYRAADRHATELHRLYGVMHRHRSHDPQTATIKLAAKQALGVKELFEDDLPAADREDTCLARIDRLIELGSAEEA